MAIFYFFNILCPVAIFVALLTCFVLDIKEHERNIGERNIVKQNSYSDEEEFDF